MKRYLQDRTKLRAQLVAAGHYDPKAEAAMDTVTLLPHEYSKKRLEQPRLN